MIRTFFLTILAILFFQTYGWAQCTVSTNANPLNADCGETIDLSAYGNTNDAVQSNDFNNGSLGSGWSSSANVTYSNPCGAPPDGSSAAWFGDNPLPRELTTVDYDLSCGGQVCFEFRMADDDACGGCSDCEDPDLPDEGVYIQYSTNGGGSWNNMYYFNPDTSEDWHTWDQYCFTLPQSAWGPNVSFQWSQPNATSTTNDHWGIDNVEIIANDCNYYYDWTHISGSPDNANQTATVNSDSTFTVIYTDGSDTCTSSVTVNVAFPDVTASASPTSVCPGGTSTLDADLTNIPVDTCCYTLDMDDSYGDGWNGGELEVFENGVSQGIFAASGSGSVEQFCVANNSTIELQYTSGSFESENTYTLSDPSGTTIFSDGPTPNTGSVFTTTADCGPPPSYDFAWDPTTGLTSPNDSTTDATVNSTTTYTVTVTSTNNPACQSEAQVTVNVVDVQAIVASPDTITCASPSVTIDGSASYTSTGNTGYSWSTSNGNITSGSTGSSITVDEAGDYQLIVTEVGSGCTHDTTVTVEVDTVSPNAVVAPPDTLTCNVTNVTLDGSGSTSSFGNHSYSWSNGDAGSSTSVNSAGSYTLTVTDLDNGCVDDTTVVVEIDTTSPQAIVAPPDTLTCSQTSVTIDGSASTSSSGNVNYSWSTGSTSATTTVSNPGNYTLTVTDPDNGCTHDTTVVVEIDTISPDATVAPPDTITCSITSVTIDGSGSTSSSGNHTYSWSNGGTSSTTTVSAGGNYTLTVTDPSNGCTNDTTITVEVDTISPDANVAPPDTFFCATNAVTLDGAGSWTNSGTVQYQWTAVSGNIISGANTASADVDQPGDYQLTVTDPDNGCTDDTTVTVVQDANTPTASVAVPDTLTCNTATVTLDGTGSTTSSGNIDYGWNTSGGNITAAAADSSTIDVDAAGNYTLTVTDPDNGCTMDTTVTVEIDTVSPDAVVAAPDTLTCTTLSVTLDGSGSTSNSGSHTYSWSNGGTASTTSVMASGSYTLTVTDSENGCTDDTTVTVIADSVPPSPAIPLPDTITCVNTSVTVDGSGSTTSNNATQYSWSTGDNTATTTVTAGGNYTLTVTDTVNGCTEDSTVTVEVDTASPNAFVAEPDTFYCTTTSVTLDGSGSTSSSGNLSYSWSSGGTSATETVTAAGSYTLTVTDPVNGCVDDTTVTVPQDNNTPTVNIATPDTLTCATTVVTVDASGSTTSSGNADYSWNTSSGNITGAAADSSTIDVDAGASYTVTVTDPNNGCSSSGSVTVEQDTASPHAVVASPDTLTCAVTNVTIDGAASTSNSGNLNYSWSSGGTNATETVTAGGNYTLTVTDPANGCVDDTTLTVEQDTASPMPLVATPDTLTCTTTSVTIDGSASATANNATSYSWSTGDATATTTVTAGGNYTLTITDTVNGCVDDTTVAVIQDTVAPTAVVAEPDTFFCSTSSVNLDGSSSTSNSGNVSYQWTAVSGNITSGATTATPTVDQAGDYQLVVTDPANGCTDDTTVTVPQDNNIPVATIATPDTLTCMTSVVTVDASSSTTSSGNIEYSWNTSGGGIVGAAADSSTIDVDAPATYTVTVTDPANGCTSSKSVAVEQDTVSPHAVVAEPDTLTCAVTNVILDGSGSTSNSGNLNYSWSSGGNSATESVTAGGNYTLTVTDPVNGCVDDTTIAVEQDTVSPTPLVATPDTLTCTNTSVTIDGSASTTANNATSYSWSTGDATATTTVTAGGSYTLTITDTVNGCLNDTTVTVVKDTVDPTIAVAPVDTLSCTDTTVVVDAGGTTTNSGGITYSWGTPNGNILSGTTSDSIEVDAAGDYTVTVTDPANGCTQDTTVTVEQDESVPVVNIAAPDTFFCNTVSVTLNGASSTTASGNIDFQWNPITGNIISGASTASADADQAGSYSLTVTDPNNGCTATDTTVVPVDTTAPQVAVAPIDTLTCSVTSVTVDASGSSAKYGPVGYSWSTTNGNITSGTTSSTVDVDAGGDYDLTITDNYSGCTADTTLMVFQDTVSPNPVVADPDTLTCAVTSVTVDGSGSTTNSGATQYFWSTSTGNITSGVNSTSIDVNQPGDYTLTITDAYSGCSEDTTVTVQQNIVQPTVNFATPDTLTCTKTTVTVDGSGSTSNSGGHSYLWSTTNGSITSGTTASDIDVDQPGSYQLVVTDNQNGCKDTNAVNVVQDANIPVADAGPDTILPCKPPNVRLDGTGSDNGGTIYYEWTTTSGVIIANGATDTALVGQTGTYSITVTDSSNGCQATDQVVVNNPPALNHNVSITDLACSNDSTGQIVIHANGGDGNYQYSIDSGATYQADSVFSGLDGGVFDVMVEDGYGCHSSSVDTVNEPDELILNYFSVDSVTCNGACDGSVTAFPDGGTVSGPYTFYWSNNIGDTTQAQPDSVCAGNYSLEIQDDNGCSVDTNFSMPQPTPFAVWTSSDSAHCDQPDGAAMVDSVSGSTPSYSYQWDAAAGNQTTDSASGLTPGTYDVVISDANGCDTTVSVSVGNIAGPVASIIDSTNAVCNGDCNGSAEGMATGGITPYDYQWNDPSNQTSAVANGLCAGIYDFVVTDDFGCVDTADVTITEPAPVTVSTFNDTTICINDTATLGALNPSGGTPGYSFNWTGVDSGRIQTVTPGSTTTSYEVIATDTNGCASAPATMTVSFNGPLSVTAFQDDSICPGEDITLSAVANGGDQNYDYSWSPGGLTGSSITVSPATTTQYQVILNDGCTTPSDSDSAKVVVLPEPQPTFTTDTLSGCYPVNAEFTNTTDPANVGSSCAWTFGDNTYGDDCGSATHSYETPGDYDVSLTVTSPYGCVGDTTYTNLIHVYGYPVADFTADPQPATIFNPEIDFTNFSSTNSATFEWTFGELGESTEDHPTFTFPDDREGEYPVCLKAVTAYGCEDTVCKDITIEGKFVLYVPNSFTPDGDGRNDEFFPVVQGHKESDFLFVVYNRWGEKVFESRHSENHWDGKVGNGRMAKEDVYVWKVVAVDKYTGQKKVEKGHVTLIK